MGVILVRFASEFHWIGRYYNIILDDLQVDNESDNCVTGSMDLKKNVPLCHIVYIIMDDMSFITRDVEKY